MGYGQMVPMQQPGNGAYYQMGPPCVANITNNITVNTLNGPPGQRMQMAGAAMAPTATMLAKPTTVGAAPVGAAPVRRRPPPPKAKSDSLLDGVRAQDASAVFEAVQAAAQAAQTAARAAMAQAAAVQSAK